MAYFLEVDEINYNRGVSKIFVDTHKIISLKEISSEIIKCIRIKNKPDEYFNLLEKGYKTIIKLERDVYYSKLIVEKLMKICNFNIVEE